MAKGKRGDRVDVIVSAVDKVAAPIRAINRRFDSMLAPIRKVGRSLKALAAEAHLAKLGRGIRGLGKAFGVMGIAGVGAVALLHKGLERLAQRGDDVGKLTRRLGLSVEQFQKWEFLAARQGVSTDVFRRSVGALVKRLGDLKAGTGALDTLLKVVDPQLAENLKRTADPSEALAMIFDRIARLRDPTKKAALAAAAFSRAGLPMIQIADAGADGIAELLARADELAGVMAEDSTKASEDYIDALTDLRFAVSGLVQGIGFALLPTAREIVSSMTDWVVANREWLRTSVVDGIRELAQIGGEVVGWLREALPAVKDFLGSLGRLRTVAKVLGVIFAVSLIAPIVALVAAIGVWPTAIAALAAGVVAFWDDIKKAVAPVVELMRQARELAGSIGDGARNLIGQAGQALGVGPGLTLAGGPQALGAGQALAGGGRTRADLDGTLRIVVDSRGRASVASAQTTAPGVALEVDTGRALAGD